MQAETALSLGRWLKLGEKLGIALTEEHFLELLRRYGEPQRCYHTAEHIAACLRHFDTAPIAASDDAPVAELALWMHDIVYDPKAFDNEQRSVELASEWLQSSGAQPGLSTRVSALIMATAHGNVSEHFVREPAADWVVDIDLTILGSSAARFAEFGKQIRQEYSHVPEGDYITGRLHVLRSFLNEPRLYRTDWFETRLEPAARKNLQAEVEQLEQGLPANSR